MLADLAGRHAEARRHFDAALEMVQRMGAAAPLIHAQLEFGRFLRRTGDPGDRQRGEELMALGLAGFEDLGLPPIPGIRSSAQEALRGTPAEADP